MRRLVDTPVRPLATLAAQMGQLVVVRHGQASLFAADYDELSSTGIAQARALGVYLRGAMPAVDRVFTGPAKRQRDTAALASEAASTDAARWPDPELVGELDEHDAFALVRGALMQAPDDRQLADLAAGTNPSLDPRARSAGFQRLFEVVMSRWLLGALDVPGVETWIEFSTRVERGIARMLEAAGPGAKILAFTSVGPLAVMLRRALEGTSERSFATAWRLRNSSMTTFAIRGQEFTLDGFNALPHLPDPRNWTFR